MMPILSAHSPLQRMLGPAVALLLVISTTAAQAQMTPVTCTVAADKTPVYAGFSNTYYTLGTLDKGAQVSVVSIELDWYKIVAPPGTFSLASKAFVDARGDGKSGTVNRDKVTVLALAADPAVKTDRVQTELAKGTVVQIVGENGSYYRIIPPAGAFAYLAPGSLLNPPPVPAPPQPAVAPTTPVPATQIAVPPATTQNAGITPPLVPPTPTGPTLSSLDEQLRAAMKLPLDQQPLSELTKAYQGLLADPNLPAAQLPLVRQRLALLERSAQLQATLAEVTAVERKMDAAATQPAPGTRGNVQAQPHYDAVGQLQASVVYDGVKLPRLYRLVDPASGRTVAYVQPGAAIEPGNCLGRMVGLVGQAQEDPGLKLPVLTVKKADVLEPSGPGAGAATQPAN